MRNIADQNISKALLFGFGRMGITHISLVNGHSRKTPVWYIVEPNWILRLLIPLFLPKNRYRSIAEKGLRSLPPDFFDYAFICSPPSFHSQNATLASKVSKKIFVEKPCMVPTEAISNKSMIYTGYVLQHSPLLKILKGKIGNGESIENIRLLLRSNTASEGMSGWRADQRFGGLINEFGSHLVSILFYLTDRSDYNVNTVSNQKSINGKSEFESSDIGVDSASITGSMGDQCKFEMHLDWASTEVRKPSYEVYAKLDSGRILKTDFYTLTEVDELGAENRTNISDHIAQNHSRFYVRGLDFSAQAVHFIESTDFADNFFVSNKIDSMLQDLRDVR